MIVITGGAGFIGANIVKKLNQRGETDLLVVDNITNTDKLKNLYDLSISDYMDKQTFRDCIRKKEYLGEIDAVFHQGACSDTMVSDGQYVMENNYIYSKDVLDFCIHNNAPFIYASSASVYGGGDVFIESPKYESVLNAYAWSKLMFDNYIRRQSDLPIQCVGLRYFNVYGPREGHKGRMASVAWHFYHQYQKNKAVSLFCGTDGYGDGEQLRDFVYVDDVVDVNMFFLDHPSVSGIYNVGTGRSQSFNDVALAVVNSCRNAEGRSTVTLEEAMKNNEINYIPLPDSLVGKYQSYTEASLDKLKDAGYDGAFASVQQGVERYLEILSIND